MVIGHGLWLRAYGASPSVIGTVLRTQRASYTIVGVAPQGFTGTVEDDEVEFWIPLEQYEPRTMITDRDSRQTWLIASVRASASTAEVAAVIDGMTRTWKGREPERYRKLHLRVEPFGDSWRAGLRSGTRMLGAAAGLLLLIAALNVGCLLLARVLDRRGSSQSGVRSVPRGAGWSASCWAKRWLCARGGRARNPSRPAGPPRIAVDRANLAAGLPDGVTRRPGDGAGFRGTPGGERPGRDRARPGGQQRRTVRSPARRRARNRGRPARAALDHLPDLR